MSTADETNLQAAERLFQTALRLHQEGQLQRAEHLYRETLRQRPRHADALNMLGVIACQTRNFGAGIGLLRQALALDPDHADYNNNLGMALLESGERDAAQAAFERAVQSRPRFAEAHCNLANLYLAAHAPSLAEQHYRRALRARPDYVDALNNLGNLLRQLGRAAEAAPLLHKLVQAAPDFAQGHFNLALTLQAQAHYDDAIAAFRRALDLDRHAVQVWEALGQCYRQRGALSEAEGAYREALEQAPGKVALWNALGIVQFAQNRAGEALHSFERALALDGGAAITRNLVGMAHAALGDRVVARQWFESALAADPACGEAYRNLAELQPDPTEARRLIAQIEAQLARVDLAGERRIELDYALGKLHDDLHEYAAAFRAFAAANQGRRARASFNARAQARYIDALIEHCDEGFLARARDIGVTSELPVFIVGMPRSGTTLVEQILATHSQVFGAGELTFFPEHVPQLAAKWGRAKPFPACLAGSLERLAELAPLYLEQLMRLAPSARRITDKMPYNFLYLGVIAALFPRAAIVHCRRDPMATCFSIYTRDLAGSHPYSYDLETLAAAYAGYHRLMRHWRQVLGPRLLDIDYESLVEQPESEIRRLIDHLGLPWEEACLSFHQTRRTVTTASQWQVRQPIYQSAREHWRAYASHLGPLAAALGPLAGAVDA